MWNNFHYFIILTMFNTEQTCLLEYMEYTGILAKYETSKTTALNLIIYFFPQPFLTAAIYKLDCLTSEGDLIQS